MTPGQISEVLARARAIRERAVREMRRIERLELLVANERWMGGERSAMQTDREYKFRIRELLRTIDDEIHRLAEMTAAGTEREAS